MGLAERKLEGCYPRLFLCTVRMWISWEYSLCVKKIFLQKNLARQRPMTAWWPALQPAQACCGSEQMWVWFSHCLCHDSMMVSRSTVVDLLLLTMPTADLSGTGCSFYIDTSSLSVWSSHNHHFHSFATIACYQHFPHCRMLNLIKRWTWDLSVCNNLCGCCEHKHETSTDKSGQALTRHNEKVLYPLSTRS